MLHLHSLQAILPLFAVFDRTNYLRWCSIYVEDMQNLSITHPDVYDHFLSGKFSVKRTPGKFKAVGADQCLEQTINRSKKSNSGIIGRTKKKEYVAQWDLIYHKMLEVSNLHRKLSGIKSRNAEHDTNHEFTQAQTDSTEQKLKLMMNYICSHENPAAVNPQSEKRLHNIITQAIMNDEIRANLLNVMATGQELYLKYRKERLIERNISISDVIHRNNMKTFKSVDDSSTVNKNSKKTESDEAQKIIDLACERNYSLKELLRYDLVQSSPLLDDTGHMVDAKKSTLCSELEKKLQPDDFIAAHEWNQQGAKMTYVVDVMGFIRRINISKCKTFGDLFAALCQMLSNTCTYACHIDMVFDTYIQGSVKDSERSRRCKANSIEVNNIAHDTLLPVEMTTFWSSLNNKDKLQKFIRCCILTRGSGCICSDAEIILSGMGTCADDNVECQSAKLEEITCVPALKYNIEEADLRIIPHILHAVQHGAECVFVLSNDTDVLVLCLQFWGLFDQQGLKELWQRTGARDKTKYSPIHKLVKKLNPDMCQVLSALHMLTACDVTSKGDTKYCALKADPHKFLKTFSRNINAIEQDVIKAEEYLVKVLQSSVPYKTMDDLSYYMYHHHSKNMTLLMLVTLDMRKMTVWLYHPLI